MNTVRVVRIVDGERNEIAKAIRAGYSVKEDIPGWSDLTAKKESNKKNRELIFEVARDTGKRMTELESRISKLENA